jgi:hypothetical protein
LQHTETGFLVHQRHRVQGQEPTRTNKERQMASEGDRLQKIIGERLRDMFQQTVEEPLPPLILQVIRRLHECEEAEAEASVAKEPIKPIKWDLVLRGGWSEPPRQ